MSRKLIVTNFAYGTGPYLRTTELAIAFNDELEKAGYPRIDIIVPLVYGENQRKIMTEEGLLSDEVILDAELGGILEKVFYGNGNYVEYLKKWVAGFKEISREAQEYLLKKYGSEIAVELNRSPRILYGIAPAYSASFGYFSRMFKELGDRKASGIAECIEKEQRMIVVGYPGLFSKEGDYKVPPISLIPQPNNEKIDKGIFITKSGIPNLERLYKSAANFGIKIYSNSDYSPALITNKNILLHFARAGWASIWFSMLAEKPLVVPEYDPADDPEIYFNNKIIEKLGIGIVYHEESLEELLIKLDKSADVCRTINKEILDRWGTLDGTQYAAKIFAKDFLKKL